MKFRIVKRTNLNGNSKYVTQYESDGHWRYYDDNFDYASIQTAEEAVKAIIHNEKEHIFVTEEVVRVY